MLEGSQTTISCSKWGEGTTTTHEVWSWPWKDTRPASAVVKTNPLRYRATAQRAGLQGIAAGLATAYMPTRQEDHLWLGHKAEQESKLRFLLKLLKSKTFALLQIISFFFFLLLLKNILKLRIEFSLYLMFHAHHTLRTAPSIRTWGSGGAGGHWRSELLLKWGTWSRWTSFLHLFCCFRQCWRGKHVMIHSITTSLKRIHKCPQEKMNVLTIRESAFSGPVEKSFLHANLIDPQL